MEIPNLAGVATKDLVEQIGSGSFKASYINWSRTMHLLRTHAPGWMVEAVPAADGSLLHRAPVGAYLQIRFRHPEGYYTPSVPQAVMDHRNNAIPFDKITARDVTDTQRRGACMAAAMTFGLAYELWAKMPLESGYSEHAPLAVEAPSTKAASAVVNPTEHFEQVVNTQAKSELDFIKACELRGLNNKAIQSLLGKVKNNYDQGIKNLENKDQEWVDLINGQSA